MIEDILEDKEEIIKMIIDDLNNDFDDINWRKAKSILEYIEEAVENGENIDEIYQNASHQLEELELT